MGDRRRQEILDSALALAAEGGLNAITMRAVAKRLGVTAMALYPHVQSKDDLLDGVLGRLLAEVSLPDPALPWQDKLREIAYSMRAVARRYPSVVQLLYLRPTVTPDALQVVDSVYSALLEAGVPPEQVARVERLVSTVILGYAVSEAGGRFGTGTLGTRERRGQLAGAELPAHHKLGPLLDAPWSWDAEFDADLADLYRLIKGVAELRLRRPARHREVVQELTNLGGDALKSRVVLLGSGGDRGVHPCGDGGHVLLTQAAGGDRRAAEP